MAQAEGTGWESTHRERRIVATDGTGIAYEVLGKGEKTIVLANGLGGRLYAWTPAIEAFWTDYRIITWDYRGLFASDSPKSKRKLSVANHVDDITAILAAEKVQRAVFVGWSMGVQVSLDVAATFPELVAGLVLINGTHGKVLSTGFQPLVSIPFLPKRLHALLDWLRLRRPSCFARRRRRAQHGSPEANRGGSGAKRPRGTKSPPG